MPDVLVRNVEDRVLEKLKRRARANGRSLQGELIEVLKSLAGEPASDEELAHRIKRSLRGRSRRFTDSAVLLREDRAR